MMWHVSISLHKPLKFSMFFFLSLTIQCYRFLNFNQQVLVTIDHV